MRIVTQRAFGGPEVLFAAEAEVPEPGSGQVRVRAAASGVNPVDIAVREGRLRFLGDPPFVLGWDVAGTIDALGPDVRHFSLGDRVFGMPRFPHEAGGYAEYVIGPASGFAPAPTTIGLIEAAAVPLAGLTAWQAIVMAGRVSVGQRVLVHAAGGGVGHFAVQLAKALGANVIATSSAAKLEFVSELGADEIIDYHSGDFTRNLHQVDVALDPLGGEAGARTLDMVCNGGVLATLVPGTTPEVLAEARRRGIRCVEILLKPDPLVLQELAKLIERGSITPHVGMTLPLSDAAAAHAALSASAARGKIVLVP